MNPSIILVAIRVLLPTKALKVLLWIMLALILLPALCMVVIVETPAATLQAIFGTSSYGAGASSANPAPTGIAILGDFTYPDDNYAPGNCTYWAFARRAQVNLPIPNTWGNAATWASGAQKDGYLVDQIPTQYAIMQTANSAHGLGHVAFVEDVKPDGSWDISEMNALGLYIVDHKNMPATAAKDYNFIHAKD
jgi:surface antigen